jgi:hypothetical protein
MVQDSKLELLMGCDRSVVKEKKQAAKSKKTEGLIKNELFEKERIG